MTTNTNIAKRARINGSPAATQTPAQYPGTAKRRVACPGMSSLNPNGLNAGRHSFRPEGVQRRDRRQLQH